MAKNLMLQGADDAEAARRRRSRPYRYRDESGVQCVLNIPTASEPQQLWQACCCGPASPETANLVKRMEALVPVELLPRSEDTQASLVARLAKSEYLHPKKVLCKGNVTGRHRYVDLIT